MVQVFLTNKLIFIDKIKLFFREIYINLIQDNTKYKYLLTKRFKFLLIIQRETCHFY